MLPIIVFIVIFLITSYLTYGFFRLGDDTYIYLQYVRSIIEHGEIAFNSGEPTYGFTSPLWLFFLSVISKLTGNYLQSPHLLTLIFSSLTIIIWFIILQNSQLKNSIKYLFLLAVVLDPNLLKHSYLGMESSASFFFSSAIALSLHNFDRKFFKHLLPLLFGLFFLTRPESIIIYMILITVLLKLKKINTKDMAKMLTVSLIVVLPWLIFSKIYFGSFLPTTISAKGASYLWGSRFFVHLFDSIKIFAGNYLLIISAILLFSFFKWNSNKQKVSFYITIFSIICLTTFYSLSLNREIVYARYYCMVFPFIYLVLLNILAEAQIEPKYKIYYLSSVILYSIIISLVFSNLTKENYEDEKIEDDIVLWVKANTNPTDIIVRSRIGKIGFLSKRKILDPMGIINPQIIDYNKKENSAEYFSIIKPNYLIGTFVLENLARYAEVKTIKEFNSVKSLLPRHMILGKRQSLTVPVYKLNWYSQ